MATSNRHFARQALRAAVVSALLVAAPYAAGQSVSATLRGNVTLDAVPANGANITATNVNTGLVRTVTATNNGNYTVAGLPPGAYRIDVNTGGKTSTQTVVLQVGQTATLDLNVGATQARDLESVVVSAERLVEAKTSEVSNYISLKEIELLPQNSRNFLQFAETVPGMQFIQSANGQTELRSGAQSANGVNVYIDGVGQKNYVTRGGVGGQGKLADSAASNRGTRGNPFPQLAIGEYKVITSNYKAEFDQVSSAAIVAATKSGTNEFEVQAFYDTTNEDWRAKDPREEESGTKAPSEQNQYGIGIGGPIIRDRMHFFVTYEKKEIESPATVFPTNWVGPLPPAYADLAGTFNEEFDEDLIFAKIDMTLGDANLFELSWKYRDESDYSFGDNESPSYGTVNANEDSRWDLRYQYTADSFVNDAHITYEDATFSPRPFQNENGFQLFNGGFDNNNFVFNHGGGNIYDDRGQKGWGFQDDLTFNALEFAGYHTIKTGIKYKSIDLTVASQSPFNPAYAVDVNDPTQTPFRVKFGAVSQFGRDALASDNKQYGIYLQDDWDVTDRLQVNLGIRYDYEETPAYLDYVTPQLVIEAFNSPNPNPDAGGAPYAEALRLGGINIQDYISTGNNRDAFKDAIAPRLGFSFDLTEDERHVLFGGAGRSYDRNVFEYLARETTKGSYPTYEYWFNSPTEQTPCSSRGPTCLGTFDPIYYDPAQLDALAAARPAQGAEVFMLNNNMKTPYSDQFSIGIRDRFVVWNHDWQTQLTVAYNEYHDGIIFLLGQRYPDGSFNQPPGATWGGQPWGQHPAYQGQTLGNVLLGTNGVETKATQVLLSIQKPYSSESGWGTTLAYTYTDGEENRLNTAKDDDTYIFDYPSIRQFGWNTSTGVPEHRLVMTGLFDAPWGIGLSAKLNLATPMYYSTINCVEASSPSNCFWDAKKPDTTLGFKQFDIAAQKTFTVMDNLDLRIRFDLLNVFNWENPDGRDEFSGDFGSPNPNFLNPTTYLQPTRTFKLSLSANWR